MPYNEWDDNSTPLPPSLDQMQFELAKRGSMPLRPNGSDVPYAASEVPSIRVPVQPKEPPRPASSANNVLQALIDKVGISAIPQSVLAIARGFPAGIASEMGYPDIAEKIAYEPTSTYAKDILTGISEAPKAITGSSMGFGPIPELYVPRGRGINSNDVRVMGANAKRIAGEVRDLKTDFANAQSGVRRENAFGEPTLGVKAQGAVESVAPVVYPKIEQFMENIGGLKRIDVGQKAKNYSKASEEVFKREFSTARRSGKSIDEANLEAWKASQLNDITEGAPGSLGTRYLLPTDKLVQESMLGEETFKPLATPPRTNSRSEMLKTANDLSMKNFGLSFDNLTPEQKVQLRDYLLAIRTVGKSANLPSVLESYPDFANNVFEFKPTRKKEGAQFNPETKAITVQSPRSTAAGSTIHEFQHAIQDIEGLPQGANVEMFDSSSDQGRRYRKLLEKIQDEREAIENARNIQKGAERNGVPIEDYIKENNAAIDALFQGKTLPPNISKKLPLLDRSDSLAKSHTSEELHKMLMDIDRKQKLNPFRPFDAYHQVFGEAHARNAERRRKLPFKTRREIFPESTFDVPKEQLRYSSEQAEAPNLQLKAEEKPKRQSKAEAEALGLYHPVGGGTKLKRPISEMDIQTMDNPDMPLVPKKEMKPEDMVGGAIIPLSMDLSSAGKIVTGIGGKELIVPVKTQGGYQFMQWNGDAWSSLPNVSKRIGNQIQTAREMEGVDPDKIFGVTKTMSPTAVDFNHMTTEAILNQFDPTTIPKPIARAFNTLVQDQGIKNQKTGIITYPFKTFAGIEKPEGRAQLLEISNWGGELRKNMINKMNLKDFKEAGFPDVAEARAAISAPELLDQPIGMIGHGITRFDPSGELNLDPSDPHYTYTANIKGHPTKGGYAGAFKTPISNEVAFKNYFDIKRRALSRSKASDDRAFSMSMPIQQTNQEWLDNVMAEMEAQDRAIKQGLTMDEARFALMKKEDEPKKLSPKSELGFYSNIEKAALNLKRQSGNGQAYMNDIKKQSGIHNDELEAIGLPEFLKSKKLFTTPEVQEFIANNRLKLIEKKYNGEIMPNEITDLPDYEDRLDSALFEMGHDRDNAHYRILQVAHDNMWADLIKERGEAPKYGGSDYDKYRTAGGSNYRETILKLPEKEVNYPEIDTTGWRVRTVEGTASPYTGGRSIQIVDADDKVRSMRSGFRGTDAEALEQYAAGHNKLNLDDFRARYNFKQGHYSEEPNTMINMRLDDRTDVEGKSGTLLDELQSDWHQKGREHGYAPEPVEKNAFDNLLQSINKQLHKQIYDELIVEGTTPDFAKNVADNAVGLKSITEKAKQVGREDELNDLIRRMEKTDTGVPDAPYKERWHELGIKKAIIDAVERGDDRLYMPMGKDVANRYDQSKYISKIVFDDNISGGVGNAEMEDRGSGGMIKAYDHDGEEVINKFVHNPEEIEDLIGKESAKKLFESEAIRTRSGSSGVRRRELSGVDLEVGGEGMKKYYDEVYPAVLKKFAKQYGGTFGMTEIPAPQTGGWHSGRDIIRHYGMNDAQWKEMADKGELEALRKKYEDYRKNATSKVYYYEPDEAARVKIKGGVAMKDGGAVHMNEGGDPAAARNALFEANRKALAEKQAIEQATRPRTYAERLNDMYDLGQLKRPSVRPSGGAGIVPSIEPSGNGGPSLINPLNRKDGGDVNLDAMRLALTKGR